MEKVFTKLFEAAEIAKFSKDERIAYEESLKYYRDLNNVVNTSRQEGVQQGIQEGIQQVIQQGQDKRSIEVAKVMKANGEPVEKIMLYTNLSRNEIEAL